MPLDTDALPRLLCILSRMSWIAGFLPAYAAMRTGRQEVQKGHTAAGVKTSEGFHSDARLLFLFPYSMRWQELVAPFRRLSSRPNATVAKVKAPLNGRVWMGLPRVLLTPSLFLKPLSD